MLDFYQLSSIYLGFAVLSAILAYHLKLSIALVEICIGALIANISIFFIGHNILMPSTECLKIFASIGSVLLTFLAGTELDPVVLKNKKLEVFLVGIVGFISPFLGGYFVAYYFCGWELKASLIAGIALSTTSMAVAYAVMIETGLNKTEFGKGILASCFINDVGTVMVLGFFFSPFTYKTCVFIFTSVLIFILFPKLIDYLTQTYGNRTAAIRAKFSIFILLFLGYISCWADIEVILSAYIAGMMIAEFSKKNKNWIFRMRTLTVGFLTPFYFIRAGSFVSISSLLYAPFTAFVLFASKILSKTFGLYPVISIFRKENNERWYYTLLMSTGLTFGTISALFGFTHGIINQLQYSLLVIVIIASAILPTLVANLFFLPKHLIKEKYHITELKNELVEE
ncbi:MAG: cation:proton antiporter [Elusimicrobiales bacterium]|nr:cation:proton antiporter [Elusimicrobiales bacterium]